MVKKRFDSWLIGIFIARIALYANFMVYAACLPILLGKWDMSATQAGSISSAFMFGYAASLFVFAWLSDHFGAKRLFLFSAVLSVFSALIFGFFAHSYLTGLLLYALAASTQGGLYTPAIILFSEHYDASRRGGAMGYLIASTSIGYAFSLVVSGLCLVWGGYRVAFIGSILAIRALLGFGAGGIAPIAFGAVLDLTNSPGTTPETWGWAFMVLGLGGAAATLCAIFYREPGKMSRPIKSK